MNALVLLAFVILTLFPAPVAAQLGCTLLPDGTRICARKPGVAVPAPTPPTDRLQGFLTRLNLKGVGTSVQELLALDMQQGLADGSPFFEPTAFPKTKIGNADLIKVRYFIKDGKVSFIDLEFSAITAEFAKQGLTDSQAISILNKACSDQMEMIARVIGRELLELYERLPDVSETYFGDPTLPAKYLIKYNNRNIIIMGKYNMRAGFNVIDRPYWFTYIHQNPYTIDKNTECKSIVRLWIT